ncbi:uncharacterized protein AKAME5_000068200 [Lates japonicus]|uniref:Uncharacterized protein n=1 Tax=Lates japonicus TaxID=270547 RepID=A0AAD3QWP8_LATJO|nr:uncharacterized protein AKAME5_000068200 [Lates japonicus]
MAESGRKSLVWDIRKSLLILSAGQLFQITKHVGPVAGQDWPELEEEGQGGCFDYISSFMGSKPFLESAVVPIPKDCIDTVTKNRHVLLLPDIRVHSAEKTRPNAHLLIS